MTVDFDSEDDTADIEKLLDIRRRYPDAMSSAAFDFARKIGAAEHLIHCFNIAAADAHGTTLKIVEVAPVDDDLVVTFDYGSMAHEEVEHMLYHFTQCHATEGLFENVYFCGGWVNVEEDNAQFVVHHHFSPVRAGNCRMVMELSD